MKKFAVILAGIFLLSACGAKESSGTEKTSVSKTLAVTSAAQQEESEETTSSADAGAAKEKKSARIAKAKKTTEASEKAEAATAESTAAENVATEAAAETTAAAGEPSPSAEGMKVYTVNNLKYELPSDWAQETADGGGMNIHYPTNEKGEKLYAYAIVSNYPLNAPSEVNMADISPEQRALILDNVLQGMMSTSDMEVIKKNTITLFGHDALDVEVAMTQPSGPVSLKGRSAIAIRDDTAFAVIMMGSEGTPFDQEIYDHLLSSAETLNP